MDMLDKFIEYLKPQVGTAIYVWGGQGQTFKTRAKMVAFIKKMETSTKNANRAIALLDKRLAAGIPIKEIAAYDCSGLGVDFLLEEGLISKDTTANGLYFSQCTAITEDDLRAGDLVFRKYRAKNKMHHVGIYIGNDEVVHAKGRDYGVVRESINRTGWNRYGRLKVFENEIEGGGNMTLRRGDNNAAVGRLQRDLTALGYPLADDNSYGPKTEATVKSFQRDNGLEVDGIAGPNTQGKIAELLAAKNQSADDAEKIKRMEGQIEELTERVAEMKKALSTIANAAEKYA